VASIFTKIIDGELPGRFVYTDDLVVAFLSIAPATTGHTLVVPRQEIDEWTDADAELLAHCMKVAQRIGQAAKRAFDAPRAALLIAGFEVPHMHVHVFPAWSMADFELTGLPVEPDQAKLDDAADRLRAALDD
jgi:diadenosine tetraphosphate (Ap4A) HIT family hydrolase